SLAESGHVVSVNGHESKPCIRSVEIFTSDGEPSRVYHRGDNLRVVMTVENPQRAPLHGAVSVYRSDGFLCFATNTFIQELMSLTDVVCDETFEDLPLQRGSYYRFVGLYGQKPNLVYEHQEDVCVFQIAQCDGYEGVSYIAHNWMGEPLVEKNDAARDH